MSKHLATFGKNSLLATRNLGQNLEGFCQLQPVGVRGKRREQRDGTNDDTGV